MREYNFFLLKRKLFMEPPFSYNHLILSYYEWNKHVRDEILWYFTLLYYIIHTSTGMSSKSVVLIFYILYENLFCLYLSSTDMLRLIRSYGLMRSEVFFSSFFFIAIRWILDMACSAIYFWIPNGWLSRKAL